MRGITAPVLERFLRKHCKLLVSLYYTTRLAYKNSGHFFHPIRSKTKTNRDSFAHVFPRFVSATGSEM